MTIRQRLGRLASKPFVFFSVLMVMKMYLARFVIFEDSSAWLPLATGIPSVWVFFCLVEWLAPKRKLGVYLLVDLLLTSVYFAVIMYYKYFGVIVTYHALQQVGQVTEVKSSVFSLMHPYFLLIYLDVVVIGAMMAASRKFRAWGRKIAVRERTSTVAAIFTMSLVLCVVNIWPHKDSINEIKQAEHMGILNYEAYAAIAELEDDGIDPATVTQEEIERLKGHADAEAVAATPEAPSAAGKNLIVIQMEALQNFVIGMKLEGKEITPVLNKLADEAYYFPNFYQQVGQGNTSDAEFVVNTSFYIPPNGAASQVYGNKELPSLPRLLRARGYDTATFHTNDVVFWNRDNLYQALGFDRYYDKTFYGEEDSVFFGASDEVLYDKTADELVRMSRSGKPFYAQIISMSAHHPFSIPKRKYRMELPERYEDTLVGNYIRSQNYADEALGQFIDRLKRDGLWENSVIVLYGDHLGLPKYSLTSHERSLMKEIFGYEYDVQDMLNIPLMIVVPGAEPQRMERIGGQSDLLPTIAGLLEAPLNGQLHFGQDLFRYSSNLLPQRYYLPSGSVITDRGVFVPGRGYRDGVSYAPGGMEPKGPAATEDEFERALQLIRMSDSYVKSLPEWRD